jgi:hypothetical protein
MFDVALNESHASSASVDRVVHIRVRTIVLAQNYGAGGPFLGIERCCGPLGAKEIVCWREDCSIND